MDRGERHGAPVQLRGHVRGPRRARVVSGDRTGQPYLFRLCRPAHPRTSRRCPLCSWMEIAGLISDVPASVASRGPQAWNVSQHRSASQVMAGHTGVVCALAYHDRKLYSGSDDGSLRVWSVDTYQSLMRVENQSGGVCALLIVTAPRLLLISGSHRTVTVRPVGGRGGGGMTGRCRSTSCQSRALALPWHGAARYGTRKRCRRWRASTATADTGCAPWPPPRTSSTRARTTPSTGGPCATFPCYARSACPATPSTRSRSTPSTSTCASARTRASSRYPPCGATDARAIVPG